MQDALNTMQYALSIKRLNEQLYEHLCGSILYLIRYSEKNDVILPNKSALTEIIAKSRNYINAIKNVRMPHHVFDEPSDDG
jgi:hypothetical protein